MGRKGFMVAGQVLLEGQTIEIHQTSFIIQRVGREFFVDKSATLHSRHRCREVTLISSVAGATAQKLAVCHTCSTNQRLVLIAMGNIAVT